MLLEKPWRDREFSDLKVVCKVETWNLYKAVLGSQGGFSGQAIQDH